MSGLLTQPSFSFDIAYQSKKSRARVGRITTPHGIIETPNFVPVGTHGTLKALDSATADKLDVQLMFCNTYHLLLQPGPEIVQKMGGLHSFMGRKQPIITDSGGFQVFSLMYGTVKDELKSKGQKKGNNAVLRITEEGVLFRSYRDGSPILLTPESSVRAQKQLGGDIIIPLDELPPYHTNEYYLRESFERTHRWEKRSLDAHRADMRNQAMYSVVHGGVDPALRRLSIHLLRDLPFDGFAIGGSLGKNRPEMIAMLSELMPHIPKERPNHLLGIGDLLSLEACIPLGIDTFDSSHPTRCARHGLALSATGDIKLLNACYKHDMRPLDETCDCSTCQNYSRAYIHHLFKAREVTAHILVSVHNIAWMMRFMKRYRQAILDGDI